MPTPKKSAAARNLEASLLALLALTLLYLLPAFLLEWSHLVEVFKGYSFVPAVLVLGAGMSYLSYLTARIARDSFIDRGN